MSILRLEPVVESTPTARHWVTGLLRAVLENLMSNAWKYSSKADHARIEFGRTVAEGAVAAFVARAERRERV